MTMKFDFSVDVRIRVAFCASGFLHDAFVIRSPMKRFFFVPCKDLVLNSKPLTTLLQAFQGSTV